jgi:hypothetical protein
METGKIAIDHLDDNNYTTWSTRLVFLLKTRKLQQALLPDFDAARNVDVDMQAQAIIGLHVKDHLLSIIKDAKTARDAWEQLAKLFKDKSKAKISQLRRELNSLKMERGETVTRYIARATDLRDELVAAGDTLFHHDIITPVLSGLPSSYAMTVALLQDKMDDESTLSD